MIIFHFGQIETCGAVLQTFGIVEELNKRGVEACICTNYKNDELLNYYNVPIVDEGRLREINPGDIIIANWWADIPKLEGKEPIRRIQWIRTKDDEFNKEALKYRQREGWEYISNSEYTGDWIKRPYTIIPNYINSRFFSKHLETRDIDVLIEGNYEPNKNIKETIKVAKKISNNILWFGRQTVAWEGVKHISNPNQEDIPNLYKRSKIFLKLSKTEGFSNPILEAMASGCLVITRNMGGNDFCKHGHNCFYDCCVNLKETIKDNPAIEKVKENAYKTAQKYTLDNTVNKFLKYINENNQGVDKTI